MSGLKKKRQVTSENVKLMPRAISITTAHQDGEGGPVVEPEGGVVDVALLGLEVAGEASERTIHGEAVGVCTLRPKL